MSDPGDPRPLLPLPEPFAAAPRPLKRPGCSRGALIGCGALIALFGIGAVALTLRADRMLVWILQRLEAKVESKLPPDLTPPERQRFTAAFDHLYSSLQQGQIDPVSIQGLQRELFTLSGDVDRGLTREQVLRLTEAVEKAAGGAGAGAASAPGSVAPGMPPGAATPTPPPPD
jgi:hypothetical protein